MIKVETMKGFFTYAAYLTGVAIGWAVFIYWRVCQDRKEEGEFVWKKRVEEITAMNRRAESANMEFAELTKRKDAIAPDVGRRLFHGNECEIKEAE